MNDKQKLEELISEKDALRKKLSILNESINQLKIKIFLDESEFKIGDRVIHTREEFEITSCRAGRWGAEFYGRKVLKSGELGMLERSLYSTLTRA